MKRLTNGFTLMELMISIVFIGILVAIAIPSYQNYTRKNYYAEVVQAAAPYRVSVSECVQKLGTVAGCSAGANGIPAPINDSQGAVSHLAVTDGIITVTPVPAHGITAADTYVLTPTVDTTSGVITWVSSGGGVTNGYTS